MRKVPTGSPSRCGDVAISVFEIMHPSFSTPFYSVLVSVSIFLALSTVFHSTNSPDNSPAFSLFFRSYFCLIGRFNYISLYEHPPVNPDIILCDSLGVKHQLTK